MYDFFPRVFFRHYYYRLRVRLFTSLFRTGERLSLKTIVVVRNYRQEGYVFRNDTRDGRTELVHRQQSLRGKRRLCRRLFFENRRNLTVFGRCTTGPGSVFFFFNYVNGHERNNTLIKWPRIVYCFENGRVSVVSFYSHLAPKSNRFETYVRIVFLRSIIRSYVITRYETFDESKRYSFR